MKHLLTLIISLIAMTASAQWNDTMGNYITWMEAEAPFGWNLFTVEEANEGDDSELLLVQYGAWKDGQMLNAFYPNGSIEAVLHISARQQSPLPSQDPRRRCDVFRRTLR